MELIKPKIKYGRSFVRAVEELRIHQEDSFYRVFGRPLTVDQYINLTEKHAQRQDLPQGWVPYVTFWLVDKGEFIGELHFRYVLTDYLRNYGGHIGYTIRPSKRKKGYGKQLLALALPRIKTLGYSRVLVTCDETNIASRKIIEANAGSFYQANAQGNNMPQKLLYWIDLK
jgi:predicted acetyltransferase